MRSSKCEMLVDFLLCKKSSSMALPVLRQVLLKHFFLSRYSKDGVKTSFLLRLLSLYDICVVGLFLLNNRKRHVQTARSLTSPNCFNLLASLQKSGKSQQKALYLQNFSLIFQTLVIKCIFRV